MAAMRDEKGWDLRSCSEAIALRGDERASAVALRARTSTKSAIPFRRIPMGRRAFSRCGRSPSLTLRGAVGSPHPTSMHPASLRAGLLLSGKNRLPSRPPGLLQHPARALSVQADEPERSESAVKQRDRARDRSHLIGDRSRKLSSSPRRMRSPSRCASILERALACGDRPIHCRLRGPRRTAAARTPGQPPGPPRSRCAQRSADRLRHCASAVLTVHHSRLPCRRN